MGFFEIIKGIANGAVNGAKKAESNLYKEDDEELQKREEVLQEAEKNYINLNDYQKEKYKEAKEKLEKFKEESSSEGESYFESDTLYGGKTLVEWNADWINMGHIIDADFSKFDKCVGLYRYCISGNIVYIGRATDLYNGSFKEKLNKFRNNCDINEKKDPCNLVKENIGDILVDILVVGNSVESITLTKNLEKEFILKFDPPWNKIVKE